jgi:hypothetical protein
MDAISRFGQLCAVAVLGLGGIATAQQAHAQASDWSVVLNGKAYHVNAAEDWNEANWGLGVEREFASGSRWVKVVLGNGFKDSQNEMSYMAGGGIKRRFRLQSLSDALYVDVGVVGFLMTRQDYNSNRPFPGLLPALTVGTRHVAVNVTYLPQAAVDRINRRDPDLEGAFFIQLKLNPSLFAVRGARGWDRLVVARNNEP